jgi:PEP-CTERM motif
MGRLRPLLIGSVVLLLISAGSAHAVPILYYTSGQIQLGDGAYEDFVGSFVLSDPVVSFFDGDDTRGDELDAFALSNFTISSASYSLSGQGYIGLWWALDAQPVWINRIDSRMRIDTPLGVIENWQPEGFGHWDGAPGTQPIAFSDFHAAIGTGVYPYPGRIQSMSAVRADAAARVPEPSALLLYGVGMAGFALLRGRCRIGRRPRHPRDTCSGSSSGKPHE